MCGGSTFNWNLTQRQCSRKLYQLWKHNHRKCYCPKKYSRWNTRPTWNPNHSQFNFTKALIPHNSISQKLIKNLEDQHKIELLNYIYRIFLRFLRNQTGKQQKIRIVTWFWREKGKRRRRRRHHPRRGSRWRGRRGRGERERRREGGEREGERRERDRWTEPPPLSPHSIPPPPLLAKTKTKTKKFTL